jgi:hypothetical protein
LLFTKQTWTAIALSGTTNGFPDEYINGDDYEELKALLSKRRLATLKALPTSQAHAKQQNDRVRTKGFKTRSELNRLLNNAWESTEDQNEVPSVKRSCRIAIILFLTAAMEEYGDFSLATES